MSDAPWRAGGFCRPPCRVTPRGGGPDERDPVGRRPLSRYELRCVAGVPWWATAGGMEAAGSSTPSP